MRGDFSRFTHDPARHYRGVLMQQGRVQLDADWNEGQAIASRWLRTLTDDVVGVSGVPIHIDAFKIDPSASTDFAISKGRMYVEGLLCELDADVTYATQPDLPDAPALDFGALKDGATRNDIVYLDAWYRAISAIEDPRLREIALGGPDTAERLQLIAQVKVLQDAGADVTCATPFDMLTSTGGGTLQLTVAATPSPPAPCDPIAQGGYQGPDNRLYRVEIHDRGPLGTATFKWSRDNGSVVAAVTQFNSPTELVLQSLGRDDYLKLKKGDFVEVTDDVLDLAGSPGLLASVVDENEADRTITLSAAVPNAVVIGVGRHPKVRRWDGGAAQATAAAALPLEHGLSVTFGATGSDFRSGDYWTFAARAVDGSVDPALAAPTPPRGVRHAYCKLAVVTWKRSRRTVAADTVQDCRLRFPPLTELPAGDGGCECAACVTAEAHNIGKLTIQAAIQEALKGGGGNVCLAPGDYQLREPIRITGSNIHLRGQGMATRLHYRPAEGNQLPAVLLRNACDCSLERLTIISAPANEAVAVADCLGTMIRGCAFLQQGAAPGNPDGRPAMVLAGALAQTHIAGNLFAATAGIGTTLPSVMNRTAAAGGAPLLLAETEITGNRFLCASTGLALGGVPIFVLRHLTVANNQFDGGAQAGMLLDGWVGPAGRAHIKGNLFRLAGGGTGVILTSGRALIDANTFTSQPLQAAGGAPAAVAVAKLGGAIDLANGQGPPVNQVVQVVGNVVEDLRGHAIAISGRARGVLIKQNVIRQVTGAGVITPPVIGTVAAAANVDDVVIENNQLSDLATDETLFGQETGGAILLRLGEGMKVAGNTVRRVGGGILKTPVVGIGLSACADSVVRDNVVSDVGPVESGFHNVGIDVAAVVATLSVSDNQVRRAAIATPRNAESPWTALRVAGLEKLQGRDGNVLTFGNALLLPVQVAEAGGAAPAAPNRLLIVAATPPSQAGAAAVDTSLAVLPLQTSSAGIANNRLEASGIAPLVDAGGLTELVFTGNRCSFEGVEGRPAVQLAASRALVLAGNTVDGTGYQRSIEVSAGPGLTAVGNVVHLPMAGVPPQWDALNVVQ